MNANSQNFDALYKPVAIYGGTLTAAGAGDATEVTGETVNRLGYHNARLVVAGRTNCASGQTLKFTVKIAESDDGSSWGSDTTIANAVTVVDGAASPQNFVYELDLDVPKRKQYARLKLTPDLSAGATDTAQWGATVILGGADVLPAA